MTAISPILEATVIGLLLTDTSIPFASKYFIHFTY
jgi:hypothetical protein